MVRCGSPCTNHQYVGSEVASTIGRITTGGTITEFTVPTSERIRIASRPARTAPCGSPRLTATRSAASPPPAPSPSSPSPPPARAWQHHVRPRRRPVVHRVRIFWFPRQRRSHHDRRFRHRIPDFRRLRSSIAERHHIGPGRRPWFTEGVGRVGGDFPTPGGVLRITTSGSVTSFDALSAYHPPPLESPQGITTGPDGALWFTDAGTNQVNRRPAAGGGDRERRPARRLPGPAQRPQRRLRLTTRYAPSTDLLPAEHGRQFIRCRGVFRVDCQHFAQHRFRRPVLALLDQQVAQQQARPPGPGEAAANRFQFPTRRRRQILVRDVSAALRTAASTARRGSSRGVVSAPRRRILASLPFAASHAPRSREVPHAPPPSPNARPSLHRPLADNRRAGRRPDRQPGRHLLLRSRKATPPGPTA